jgi:hypothetical protein
MGAKDRAIADYRQALRLHATNKQSLDGLKRLGVSP